MRKGSSSRQLSCSEKSDCNSEIHWLISNIFKPYKNIQICKTQWLINSNRKETENLAYKIRTKWEKFRWFVEIPTIIFDVIIFQNYERTLPSCGCGCRIHQLLLSRGLRSPPTKCPGYDSKQSNGEVPVILELWGMWSTLSLP